MLGASNILGQIALSVTSGRKRLAYPDGGFLGNFYAALCCSAPYLDALCPSRDVETPVQPYVDIHTILDAIDVHKHDSKKALHPALCFKFILKEMVGVTGIEPVTPSMSTKCSPAELHPPISFPRWGGLVTL